MQKSESFYCSQMNLITSELSAHRAGIKKLLKYEGLGVLCWLLHTPYIREPQTDTAIDSIAKIWQCFVFMLQLTCNMGGVFLYLLMWLVVVSDKYLGCLPAPPRLPVFFFFHSTVTTLWCTDGHMTVHITYDQSTWNEMERHHCCHCT